MEDRQTDRQEPKSDTRATHWRITSFDKDDMSRLDASSNYPLWVKEVYGGREIAPSTGSLHYQAHIACRAQTRWSSVKKWLPKSKIFVSTLPGESIAYCLKLDTSAEKKKIMENTNTYMTDQKAMEKLVSVCQSTCECVFNHRKELPQNQSELMQLRCCEDVNEDYWHRVRNILLLEPHLCGLYAKPDLYRLWKNTKSVWVSRARAKERSGGIVLPPATFTELSEPLVNEIIFSPENTNATVSPPPSLQYQEEEDGVWSQEGRTYQS